MKIYKVLPAIILSLGLTTAVHADEYLCSYMTRISQADKHNSKGVALTKSGYSKATVASIIRQDRANYYVFGKRDYEDEGDCVFAEKSNRALMQSFLNAGQIPKYAIRTIVDNNPLIRVDVYRKHIEIEIIDHDEDAPVSTIQ